MNSLFLELEHFAELANPVHDHSSYSCVATRGIEKPLGLNLFFQQILKQHIHLTMRIEESFCFSCSYREFFPVLALEETAVQAVSILRR